MFLPPKDGEIAHARHGPNQLMAKSYISNSIYAQKKPAQQFREQLTSGGEPSSVLGTVFAKWLISEYNREGMTEQKSYRLVREPVSNCEVGSIPTTTNNDHS